MTSKRDLENLDAEPESDRWCCNGNTELAAVGTALREVLGTFDPVREGDGTGPVRSFRSPQVMPYEYERWVRVSKTKGGQA